MVKNVHVTEPQGEVDPVYSFLKLTSVMPREGASVIPDEDHYCCSKTDEDIGLVHDEAAGLSVVELAELRYSVRRDLELDHHHYHHHLIPRI